MPLTITWDTVCALASELATLPAAAQTAVLDQVAVEVVVAKWPSQAKADLAAAWLARHLGTLAKQGGGTAALQSVSVGGVSKSFAVSSTDPGSLQQTRYGAEYLRLRRSWLPRSAVT